MILSGIGKRYAVALYNAARNEDIADQVNDDGASFARLFAENHRFRNFLMSPMVLTEDKKDIVQRVLGERASGLFVRFVMLLIDKKRLGQLADIAVAYTHLWEESEGIVEVRAVTAIALNHDMQSRTRQVLEAGLGKKVRLVPVTDAGIIGGMVLFIQDKIVDGSVRHSLATMRRSLSELKV